MEHHIGDSVFYMWFMILIAILAVVFVAKLKFDNMYDKRQYRRRLLSYSKAKLLPSDEGKTRSLRVKKQPF